MRIRAFLLVTVSMMASGVSKGGIAPGGPHNGQRQLTIGWEVDRRLSGVVAVFPHQTVPGRVAVSTDSRLLISRDAGRNWRALAGSGPDSLGEVNWIAFAPPSSSSRQGHLFPSRASGSFSTSNDKDNHSKHSDNPTIFYVASGTEGVWKAVVSEIEGGGLRRAQSSRGVLGAIFRRVGSGESGLAHDSVERVYVYPHDPRSRTLLAVHGDAAPGVSRSEDGGRTWKTVTQGFHVYALAFGTSTMWANFYMAASRKETPEIRCVWSSPGLGDHWFEIMRDVVPTDAAPAISKGDTCYWATADAGLYRLKSAWAAVEPVRVGPKEVDEWASVGVVLGARPGTELVYAYEPRGLGLVISEDGMQTFTSHRRGLFVGPYVRDGAHVRANANGTVFFAAVNGLLYTGRTRGGEFRIAGVDVEPAALSYARHSYVGARRRLFENVRAIRKEQSAAAVARRMIGDIDALREAFSFTQVAIRAHVELLRKPGGAGGFPGKVTVDLKPLGGAAETPMHDDGRHGDGRAGDGVYAAEHEIGPRNIMPDWRYSGKDVRGTVGLWVTASAPGELASAPGIFTVYARPESFVFWDEKDFHVGETEGEVSPEKDSSPGAARRGTDAIRMTVGPGRWLVMFGHWHRKFDVTGYHALSFWLKAEAGAEQEFNVHLCDFPENALPVTTPGVPVVAAPAPAGKLRRSPAAAGAQDGLRRAQSSRDTELVEGVAERLLEPGAVAGGYRLAAVPIGRLREGARGFQPNLTTFVVFSGEAKKRSTYWIDDIRFSVSEEDLESYRLSSRQLGAEGGGSR